MRIAGTLPLHISRAYGINPSPRPQPVFPISPIAPTAPPRAGAIAAPGRNQPAAALIAGTVPGSIDFSTPTPTPAGASLPLYRHPADKNAAATAINAGRVLDTTA